MNESIEAVTTATIGLALDAAILRHQAISSNIANLNTLNYIPQRTNFSEQVTELRRSLELRGSIEPGSLAQINVGLTPVQGHSGLPVKIQLDSEMANLSQNAVQYQALLKGLSHQFELLSTAINDGKK